MADIRIKDITTTASSTASGDFFVIDGTTGTRKVNAFNPSFGGNATVTGTLTVNSTSSFAGTATIAVGNGVAATLGLNQTGVANAYLTQKATSGDLALGNGGGDQLTIAKATGVVSISSTTASTSTSSGALVVSGGVGVAGAAYFGGTVTVASNFSIASTGFYAGGGTPGAGRFLYSATAGTMLCGQAGSSYDLSLASSTGTVILGVPTGTSNLEAAGSVKTAAPAGGTAAAWKLGTVATVSPTSPNRTIEVDIGGTIYYIHAKTTNN